MYKRPGDAGIMILSYPWVGALLAAIPAAIYAAIHDSWQNCLGGLCGLSPTLSLERDAKYPTTQLMSGRLDTPLVIVSTVTPVGTRTPAGAGEVPAQDGLSQVLVVF